MRQQVRRAYPRSFTLAPCGTAIGQKKACHLTLPMMGMGPGKGMGVGPRIMGWVTKVRAQLTTTFDVPLSRAKRLL